jgi:hypothetical protein
LHGAPQVSELPSRHRLSVKCRCMRNLLRKMGQKSFRPAMARPCSEREPANHQGDAHGDGERGLQRSAPVVMCLACAKSRRRWPPSARRR